ncbi:MAG: amidohydrolase family protein [Betaproteobacteria bacterium]|nr:amidohydrolase family protein [Betaproteobacteria bacterium]
MAAYLDAHVHLWELADGEDFWMRDKIDGLHRDFTAADLARLQDACGVGGAIVVQAMHNHRESERLLAQATGDPRLAGVVAWADLFDPALAERVGHYRKWPKFLGLRPLPPDTFGGNWIADPRSAAAFRTLEAQDVAVDLLLRVENLAAARAFLRPYGGLRCVLNHGGRPAVMTGDLVAWQREMIAFARETSVTVKCSGLVERAGVEWTKDSLKPWVAGLLEAFGSRRVMFATNWPVMTISANYPLWVNTLATILDELGLTAGERDDVMAGTAARAYRVTWPPAAASAVNAVSAQPINGG